MCAAWLRKTGVDPLKFTSNADFLRALAIALLSLTLSALILVPVYGYFTSLLASDRAAADDKPIAIPGSELQTRIGLGGRTPDGRYHLEALTDSGQALMTQRVDLDAAHYPFVEVQIQNRDPGEKIYLLWRTADEPERVQRALLYWDGDELITRNLAGHPSWRGTVTEIGFDVYGDLRDEPLLINQLRLLPASPASTLATIWSEWTDFHVWNQSSINHLWGTPQNAILSPTLAMAIWAGLALLLTLTARMIGKPIHPLVPVIIFMIPWIAIDLLWQKRLNIQLDETRHLFAGKSQHERHLSDIDADLYQYALHLKANALPEPGVRIHLLHQDGPGERHNFDRLKLQYHLLPHNIYNFGDRIRAKYVQAGDYILVLGSVTGLRFDRSRSSLIWGKKRRMPVKEIDTHPMGALYSVTSTDRSKTK